MSFAGILSAAAADGTKSIDGDTLDYHGVRLKLWAIEAPDLKQVCTDGWPAGKMAADTLAGLVKGHNVVCELKGSADATPGYAVCKADGRDLAASMANAGMAWANLAQSPEYSVAESNAMSGIVGVHAHRCLKAWEWRARNGASTPRR